MNIQFGRIAVVLALLGHAVAIHGAQPIAAGAPAWLFPLNPVSQGAEPAADAATPVHVPGSVVGYTPVQLHDLFAAVDWFPTSHSMMPPVVAQGRKPAVYACGYCHTPAGQGRPENAQLAGLPAPYIIQQLADFKTGVRRPAGPDAFVPTHLMMALASQVTPEEVAAAAEYFSMQTPIARVRIVETAQVPSSHVVGWVYVANSGSGTEPLGQRLLEFTPDAARHENRDDAMRYVAYVPLGSLQRGRAIARHGLAGAPACVSCHGETLQGVGLVPGIAGRSPSYLLRQLLAFQTGARAGMTGAPMVPVVAALKIGDEIDVAAYAASLQ